LRRLIANLESHFNAADIAPADVAYWAKLKRRLLRDTDELDLALLELEASTRVLEERVRKVPQHVRLGLGA
jgi:hypothetical protein